MIDWLSNVETDKEIYTIEADIVRLMDETESFGKTSDEFDKETGSSDRFLPKKVDMSCVHALNELHSHEIRVVPTPDRITLSARDVIDRLQNGAGFVWESDVGRVGIVREAGNRALEVGRKHCAVHSVSNVGVTEME
nr:hypothetical protein [Tanacetum cinerariifolium]